MRAEAPGPVEQEAPLRGSVARVVEQAPGPSLRAAVEQSLAESAVSLSAKIALAAAGCTGATPEAAAQAALPAALLEGAEWAESKVHGLGAFAVAESAMPPPNDARTVALAAAWLRTRAAGGARELGRNARERLDRAQGQIIEGWMHEGEDLYDAGRARDRYLHAAEGTRGALGSLAAAMGALAGGRSHAEVEALSEYGHKLAIAAKIEADVRAISSSAKLAGGAPGGPIARGVYALPVILAVREHPALAEALGGAISEERLGEILALIDATGAPDLARAEAERLLDEARGHVEPLGLAAKLEPLASEATGSRAPAG